VNEYFLKDYIFIAYFISIFSAVWVRRKAAFRRLVVVGRGGVCRCIPMSAVRQTSTGMQRALMRLKEHL
jgi:hypothetical protein